LIQKQVAPINFSQGLDQKTDPFQVAPGKFLSLINSIFTKNGLLQKRNGFQQLSTLTTDTAGYLTTFNGNLTAIGDYVNAYNSSNESWINQGSIAPMQQSTLPLIRNTFNQLQCDSAIAPNDLVCVAYTETNGATTDYKYAVLNQTTGQNLINPTLITTSSGTVAGSPRVFYCANRFFIVFTTNTGSAFDLQFITISVANLSNVTAAQTIAPTYTPNQDLDWDGVVVGNQLYIAYNTANGGQSIKVTYITTALGVATAKTIAGQIATILTMCADLTQSIPLIYVAYSNSANNNTNIFALDIYLNVPASFPVPVTVTTADTVENLTCVAQNQVCTLFIDAFNIYEWPVVPLPSYNQTDFIDKFTITSSSVVTHVGISARSIGLASKAFLLDGTIYFLSIYYSQFQPSYFLMNGSTSIEANPITVGKTAYENGAIYLAYGLPNVTVIGTTASISYLTADFISSLSTIQNSQQTTTGGIYSQTGVNMVNYNFTTAETDTAELGNNLLISGGFLWSFDGVAPVEQNFFLWPDNIQAVVSGVGGNMTAQQYYYQVIYSWSDNQGNVFRSAPSIPITVTTTGSTSSVSLFIPTLRLTYKIDNPVIIEVFRWSEGQQEYFQTSSSATQINPILAPLINDTTVDFLQFTDTWADSSIDGNALIYTTGGVLEDVNGPASNIFTLFDTRMWLVDAEDPNLLWYSKQVIENTPVEMSDLLTLYIAPNTGTTGSTGPITALAPMDDKLIIFKKDAIYYINGTGPDNTGANSAYSQAIFITSVVGCTNQNSIVLMPNGLMFQSDKGIWLLGRDLSTNYIGAPVEGFNSSIVQSANAIPDTNQCRFTLNTGQMLMYDYYFGQWGTFSGVPSISSCIYDGLHSFINSYGQIFQENPGTYLDGSNPVLLSFLTSWYNLTGLQGYQRAFFFYLLGVYYSPHKINLQISYDYESSPTQSILITPTNYTPPYGVASPYGNPSPYGGPGNVEKWRVFLERQRCQAFQIQFNEVYDPSFGEIAGFGLTLSGLNLVYAQKSGFFPMPAQNSAG
jgi:hypothetical protein